MLFRIRRRSSVAIVEIHGVIGNHVKIPEFSRLIDSVAGNQRLKALLLDIASPGGSATGSGVPTGASSKSLKKSRSMPTCGGWALLTDTTWPVPLVRSKLCPQRWSGQLASSTFARF